MKNFYFDIIKTILDQSIQKFSVTKQISIPEIDEQISRHIKATSPEYLNPEPNINYNDPLCRLGYLFTHAGANATLFEKTLEQSSHLSSLLSSSVTQGINICAVGGGPGTELLGLSKYLLKANLTPSEISFNILDIVPQWSETWNHIANESKNAFNRYSNHLPIISKSFLSMNVVDSLSYEPYAWLFENADLVVFNYLLSENKVKLQAFANALHEIQSLASRGCYFVVIDRLEYQTSFKQNILDIFHNSGLVIHQDDIRFDGVMSDEENALGDYPTRFNSRPRRWFRTRNQRSPTVFALIAQKL